MSTDSVNPMATERDLFKFEALLRREDVQVSKSPWGENDQIGRVNWVTPESRKAILERLNGDHVFDLAVDYFMGMPGWLAAGDPAYQIWMTHTLQGSINDNLTGMGAEVHEKYSYCGDSIAMYIHTGTHMDMLNHLGLYGMFWNGWTTDKHLGSRQWMKGGGEHYPPLIARGILLDIVGLKGVDCLPDSYVITAQDLKDAQHKQGSSVQKGDVVLLRTGRMTVWLDFQKYTFNEPGPGLEGVKYLCEEMGAMCIGSDTLGLEVLPSEDPKAFLPVHCYMFATAGCHIMENLYLEEIAAAKMYEFAFLSFPLKFRGSTGAPMRPVAVSLK